MNPKTPVLVGVSQILERTFDPESPREPIDLMLAVARAAVADTGSDTLLASIDSVRVVRGIWRYKQPAGYIAETLGLGVVEKVGTPFGGNSVQALVNQTALDILSGDVQSVLIVGAEVGNTLAKLRKRGETLTYRETSGDYDKMLDEEVPMSCDAEKARGVTAPIQMYPIFENALRYARGESIAAHKARIAKLWSGFSEVAADNPNAWIQKRVSAEEISEASSQNRMVSFPYPKLMNSNNAVDMGAALIMTSVGHAKASGIPEDKWVYPWAGSSAHDTYAVSHRDNLHSSPAIRFAGNKALELAGVSVSDLARVDVYSCFPSAVQVAVQELGLDDTAPLTITGGLTFGGGPLNNYVMHSIARMVELSRQHPEDVGLITANGGYLTKHAFGVYSAKAPTQDFRAEDVQAAVDAEPSRSVLEEYEGVATVESYTVMYESDQPKIGHLVCLTPKGERVWANIDDPHAMQAMTESETCGLKVEVDASGMARFV